MTAIEFKPDRGAYIRAHAWMAAIGMGGAMAVLWFLDSAHIWTGAVGGLAAIALRGWYMASEELAVVWTLTQETLSGPAGRSVPVSQIEAVKTMGSYVQVVTKGGDKHLIKYQADPAATQNAIERAKA
ncbi:MULTISPECIES: hypothetical protein [unclassified Leisingera]|uniref:hypothetical protein n=1 Tax=unclassified Leisingera TaxID=2614906 RepID=UPI0004922889|nr:MULTISPECIES: hypothetical protein [unclassified Leisingera]KIC16655.1 hypothetical protein RA21_12570 [Leisingera sp. ANG-DT]KIC24970.1 hypothetical protein RA23_08700 [Leisingera sp. ANG-S3]KIC55685.1 hypothetical protein RA22_01910 [Leisingera sp. ANG-S]KID09384.1 hypothetical protein GC1_11295 [Leisingera sp. ANG1]